ncbi:hypothetical protein V5799_003248 [Amblyomma americanum]|uniref:Uncharacterized protein n=1 Tax=Amblyomma americanum TaxID=6943 RepID=A0AAQ4D9I3_AMBAM
MTALLPYLAKIKRWTMNTSVLLSSIFFIADSVVSGCLMMENWSSLVLVGTLRRGYFGLRGSDSVLGRRNLTDVRIFFVRVPQ